MSSSPLGASPAEQSHHWPLVVGAVGGIALLVVLVFAFLDPFGGSGEETPVRYVEGVVGANSKVNPLFVYQNEVDRDIAALGFERGRIGEVPQCLHHADPGARRRYGQGLGRAPRQGRGRRP